MALDEPLESVAVRLNERSGFEVLAAAGWACVGRFDVLVAVRVFVRLWSVVGFRHETSRGERVGREVRPRGHGVLPAIPPSVVAGRRELGVREERD